MAFPGVGVVGNVVSALGTRHRMINSVLPNPISGFLGQERGISEAIIDPTRPFYSANPNNLSKGPSGSITGTQQATATGDGSGVYNEGGAYSAAAAAAAAERSSAINQLNRLLGSIGTQRDQGIARLDQSYGTASNRLNEDRTRAMTGYDQQAEQNSKEKLGGIQNVDRFANNSYTSLQRLLQGAGAGNSSLMRDLIPQLVSKSAGQRRQGVFNTFGENQQGIDMARNDATTQFDRSREDLDNQRNQQRESFLRSILQSEQDAYDQLASLQSGAAGAGARSAASAREAQLNALFGQFNPALAAKAVNLQTPELGKYTVDPAAIRQNQGGPAETAYYLPQIRKRQQQAV